MVRTILNVPEGQAVARIIPVGFGEASIVLTSAQGTDPFITTVGLSLVGVDPDQFVDVADYIKSAYADTIMPFTTDALSLDRVEIAVGLAGGTSGSVQSTGSAVAGSVGSQMAPIGMAVVARKVTADLGRRGRGRSFLPGTIKSDDVSLGGSLEPAFVTAIAASWDEFIVALATGPVGFATAPVLLHADGSTPTPITGTSISNLVGWVRKRVY